MKISGINYSLPLRSVHFASKNNIQKTNNVSTKGMNGEELFMEGRASKCFELVENLSNPKIGSKFVIKSTLPEYSELRILITPDSLIYGKDFRLGVKKSDDLSFKGRLYGSIRDRDGQTDLKMQHEYLRFWECGMNTIVDNWYKDKEYAPKLKNDYNFYIPSDGDGTRYRDITALQGGVTKPASDIPATLGNDEMSLVQGVITNFARTGKLDKGCGFVYVEPARGSAYGFLEGLRRGQIPTDKPLVFSWGDNFSDVNISRLMKNHEDVNSGFTVTVLPVPKEKTKPLSIIKTNDIEGRKIDVFVEKPKDDNFIDSCVLPEFGENKCLSAVGPYILSSQALNWIKEKYSANPESFLNPDKGFDFSSMIITPMLKAFNNGEILDDDGNPMQMKFDLIDETETWSDLGSQKDFTKAMIDVKNGKYMYFPNLMKDSLKRNIDYKNNITFNERSSEMLHKLLREYRISATNLIAYCKP